MSLASLFPARDGVGILVRCRMKVEDLMSRSVRTCSPNDDLATAGSAMWEADCGIIPVVDPSRKVLGVITDRDICIALSTRCAAASQIHVANVMSGNVYACRPEDDIDTALAAMARRQVRRLVVVNAEGRLEGILSLNDVVLRAEKAHGRRANVPTFDQVAETLKAISRHPGPPGKASAAKPRSAEDARLRR